MTTEPRQEPPGEQAPYARRMDRESSVSYMDCLFSVLAGSEQTDGRFGLMEMVAPKGREPSRHLHYTDDEGFYVLDGQVTFYVGEEIHRAGPGTFVFLPHGVPHSYTFETDAVRMLSIVAPGGLEAHFQDVRFSEPATDLALPQTLGEPDAAMLEEMGKDLAGYGTEVVGPPGPPQK
jgi:quercetin dioxygenase-like cupin family protein